MKLVTRLALPLGTLIVLLAVLWRLRPEENVAPRLSETVAREGVGVAPDDRRGKLQLDGERESREAISIKDTPGGESSADARLVVEARWDDDGSPAIGIAVTIFPSLCANALLNQQRAITDRDGRVSLVLRAPLDVGAYLDLGNSQVLHLEPGEEGFVELVAERWAIAAGRVVDQEGKPVVDAMIWVSAFMNPKCGSVVGRSVADGRFEVPIGFSNHIGAQKDGHLPSHLRLPRPAKGERIDLVLPLRGPAGRVRGTVRDENGAPIQGALALVGRARRDGGPNDGGFGIALEDGADGTTAPASRATTDAAGVFEVDSVEPGSIGVFARAPGFALGTETVHVDGGVMTEVDLALRRGLVARGVVRDLNGKPVEGASVAYGRSSRFDAGDVRTAGDGSFEIAGGPPDGWELSARKQSVGKDTTTLAGAPGQMFEWNPVLDPTLVIHGHVVDEHGTPVQGAKVVAMGAMITLSDGSKTRSRLDGRTDGEGAFLLANAEDQAYRIGVYAGDTGVLLFAREGVRPSPEPLLFGIEKVEPPSAYVLGRLVLPEGVHSRPALFPAGQGSGGRVLEPDAEGAFRDGPLVPGLYRLELHGSGYPRVTLATFELTADQERDLGLIEVKPTGQLEVVVRRQDGSPVERATIVACDRTGERVFRLLVWREATTALDLPPGSYVVRVSSDKNGAAHARVEVVSGANQPLELRLEPATTVEVAFSFPPGHEDRTIELDVFDAGDWLIDRKRRSGLRRGETVELALPGGSYRLVGRTRELGAEVFVDVVAGERGESVVLGLR